MPEAVGPHLVDVAEEVLADPPSEGTPADGGFAVGSVELIGGTVEIALRAKRA